MTIDDIKLLVASKWEEVELLDFLDIDMNDLVEILEEHISERAAEFREALS